LPDSSDWDVGNQSFTAECWIYPVASPNQPIIMGQWNNPYSWALMFSNNSNRYLRFAFKVGASYNDNISSTAVALNTWSHIALVRNTNNVFNMYLNGVSIYNTTITGTADAVASVFSVGGNAAGTNFNGYIDSLRFTKGMARYTSTFTPPTTAHSTSAGDVNKQILINSTADGVAIGTGGINQTRIAKAWVNWNGTGTVAIRDSYNVSSVSDRATGKYTVNFSTAMSDTNYSGAGNAGFNTTNGGADNFNRCLHFIPYTTSAAYANSFIGDASSPSLSDCHVCTLLVFGN